MGRKSKFKWVLFEVGFPAIMIFLTFLGMHLLLTKVGDVKVSDSFTLTTSIIPSGMGIGAGVISAVWFRYKRFCKGLPLNASIRFDKAPGIILVKLFVKMSLVLGVGGLTGAFATSEVFVSDSNLYFLVAMGIISVCAFTWIIFIGGKFLNLTMEYNQV